MEQQSVYKKQQKLTGVQFLMELPNFAAICISAILSHSMLVWLDFIDSLGNVMSELLVIGFSVSQFFLLPSQVISYCMLYCLRS